MNTAADDALKAFFFWFLVLCLSDSTPRPLYERSSVVEPEQYSLTDVTIRTVFLAPSLHSNLLEWKDHFVDQEEVLRN